MKKIMILGVILTATILIPGLASATHVTSVMGSADCEGWDATVAVFWGSAISGELDYSVVLFDGDGAEVTRSEGSGEFPHGNYVEMTDTYSGIWDLQLCGDYTVIGTFSLNAAYSDGHYQYSSMEFTAAFTCECDEPGDCFLTPGYWKNHSGSWAQNSLMLGGREVFMDDLMEFLNAPVRGDATVILAKHLIAAKLNVLNGADDSIQPVIDDADDYLAMHWVYSKPSKNEGRQDALDMKDLLADYNEQGCEEEEEEEFDDTDKAGGDEFEATSWDNLKAQYR